MRLPVAAIILVTFPWSVSLRLPPDAAELHSSDAVIFQERFEGGLSNSWKPVKFSDKTDYSIVEEGTNSVLQAKANASASGLGIERRFKVTPGLKLQWRWKIDKIPRGGTEIDINTFDHTVRIFVAFESKIGPPRTINYVWANRTKVGDTFEHPRSGRARFIVLQSGLERAGEWVVQSRDIYADWKTLFGDSMPPAIHGFGLMTDSDGTKDNVTGWYDDLTLLREPTPAPK